MRRATLAPHLRTFVVMSEPCGSTLSIRRLAAEDARCRLEGLSLEVAAGEVVALLGTRTSGWKPNGERAGAEDISSREPPGLV